MFIGREHEQKQLNTLYQAKQSKLVVIFGRRRVGKSKLVETFAKGKPALRFEGLEGVNTQAQIAQFVQDLGRQLNDPILMQAKITQWSLVFDYLTQYFARQRQKTILFLDEIQWLASNQSKLVSLLKKYWDQHWSEQKVMLILCGSVSAYMTKRVIASKALYGRVHWELCLQPLKPKDALQLLGGKRSQDEVFQYLLLLGGIPKYLQEINTSRSLAQNINQLFFTANGLFINEYQRIFYSQFREYRLYEKIVLLLKNVPLTLKEIAHQLKRSSGGGLSVYLDNLEKTLFVTCYTPYQSSSNTRLKKYKLTDEYLRFYFKYVAPYAKRIAANQDQNLFDPLVKQVWAPWLGFAFENFCLKNAIYLANLMGFEDKVLQWGPVFGRSDAHFQVDLVYVRSDRVIVLCEIKYLNAPVTTKIVSEVERKCELIDIPRGYTLERALISRFGVDQSMRDLGYFHHLLEVSDFF